VVRSDNRASRIGCQGRDSDRTPAAGYRHRRSNEVPGLRAPKDEHRSAFRAGDYDRLNSTEMMPDSKWREAAFIAVFNEFEDNSTKQNREFILPNRDSNRANRD